VRAPELPLPARRPPEAVTYKVARGGTLLEIANLYKVEHREIIEFNPGIDPQRELSPDTEVVVFVPRAADSESIGLPHAGEIKGAMPLPNGPGRRITAERWKTWGTVHTVRALDRVLRSWASEHPDWPDVLVGNLSARFGGALEPHKSHQSGRDVDLGYIAKNHSRDLRWQKMNASNLDSEKTWALLKALKRDTNVEVIYMDRTIQRLLLKHAQRTNTLRRDQLSKWLEVAPGARRGSTLIRHVPQHQDHFHVRFACTPSEARCRS
jgi:murein endopeptidase